MTTEEDKAERWYTRRDDVVRGPYPRGQISRYILLGRIRETDELRSEEGDWKLVSDCPDMVPVVMRLPPTEDNLQLLTMARMREDERGPIDRRDLQDMVPEHIKERRSGIERRALEPELFIRHRILRHEIVASVVSVSGQYKYPLIAAAVVLSVFILSYLLGDDDIREPLADCLAPPSVGVNWDNCNLSGSEIAGVDLNGASIRNARLDGSQLMHTRLANSRLDYTSLNISNLSDSDLTNSVLVGASLNGADLSNASLYKANLAYANLTGARVDGVDFRGAVLDHAIWVDQRKCAAGSTGVCR